MIPFKISTKGIYPIVYDLYKRWTRTPTENYVEDYLAKSVDRKDYACRVKYLKSKSLF
jgi:hypothetical protein